MFKRVFGLSGKQRLVAVGISALGLTAVVAVLAVMFLGLNTRTAFGSGSGGGGCFATSGPVCTFKDHQVYADFSSVSADGCIFSDAYVQAYENLTSPNHASSQVVYVNFSQWDNCTGNQIMSAYDFDPNTWMSTFTGTLHFSDTSATINGTAILYDNFTGAQAFTTTINLTLTGYGPTSTFIDNSHYRSPGFLVNNHYSGASQAAEASGVMTDQSGANLAATATLNASLNNDKGGTVQISHS